MEPYEKAYQMQIKKQDEQMWIMGMYVNSAVFVAVEHCLYGKKAESKYIDIPLMQKRESASLNTGLSEIEKQKAVDKFFAQEEARRINWRRMHKRTSNNSKS